MKKRQLVLNESEQQQLQQRESVTPNVRELRRLQAVRLYGSGQPMAMVTMVVGSSPRTIQRWVEDYQQRGISGLQPGWQGNNAKKLTDSQRAEMVQRFQRYQPNQLFSCEIGVNSGEFWTVNAVQVAVKTWYGIEYRCADSYRALLHEAEFSYQQVEGVYRSKPSQLEVAQFEEELEKK